MQAKLVSIIVPVYNVSQYLHECVDSLLGQSCSNIEIILVDDGSTDDSRIICDEYGEKDSRVRVIHQPNGGLSDARNKGLAYANGEYVMFVDSDDYVNEQYVEVMLAEIEKRQADVVNCGYGIVEDGKYLKSMCCSFDADLSREEALQLLVQNTTIRHYAWNKIYKRDLFQEIQFPVGKLFEDLYTGYKIFLKCKKISVIKEQLYYYRIRNGSIMQSLDFNGTIDWVNSIKEMYDDLADNYPECRDSILDRMMEACCSSFALWAKSKDSVSDKGLKEIISFVYCENKGRKSGLPFKRRVTYHVICYFPAIARLIFKLKSKGRFNEWKRKK